MGITYAAWRRVRAAVIARDGGLCQVRLDGVCTGVATCAHHTRGLRLTGLDMAYLVAACRACNAKVGKPDDSGRDVGAGGSTRW